MYEGRDFFVNFHAFFVINSYLFIVFFVVCHFLQNFLITCADV